MKTWVWKWTAETHGDSPGHFLQGRRPFPTQSAQVGEGVGPLPRTRESQQTQGVPPEAAL